MADNYVQDASYFGGGYFGGTTYSYWGVYGSIYGRPVNDRLSVQVMARKTSEVDDKITGQVSERKTNEINARITGEVDSYYGDRDCK